MGRPPRIYKRRGRVRVAVNRIATPDASIGAEPERLQGVASVIAEELGEDFVEELDSGISGLAYAPNRGVFRDMHSKAKFYRFQRRTSWLESCKPCNHL